MGHPVILYLRQALLLISSSWAHFGLPFFPGFLIHPVPKYNSTSSVCLCVSSWVSKSLLKLLCWELRTCANCVRLTPICTAQGALMATWFLAFAWYFFLQALASSFNTLEDRKELSSSFCSLGKLRHQESDTYSRSQQQPWWSETSFQEQSESWDLRTHICLAYGFSGVFLVGTVIFSSLDVGWFSRARARDDSSWGLREVRCIECGHRTSWGQW